MKNIGLFGKLLLGLCLSCAAALSGLAASPIYEITNATPSTLGSFDQYDTGLDRMPQGGSLWGTWQNSSAAFYDAQYLLDIRDYETWDDQDPYTYGYFWGESWGDWSSGSAWGCSALYAVDSVFDYAVIMTQYRQDLTLNVDLSSYSTNQYTRAKIFWPVVRIVANEDNADPWGDIPLVHYSDGVLINDFGQECPLGQSNAISKTFGPPAWLAWNEFTDGKWGYYAVGSGLDFPRIYLYTQVKDVRPDPINPQNEIAGVGDPIDVINGNVAVQETDIALPAPGPALVFARSYESALDYSGPLGHRWTHSLNWILTETNSIFGSTTNAWKVVQTGDGRQISFQVLSNDLFDVSMDTNWKLLKTNDTYLLNIPDGITYSFDTNGVLQSISDPWQNEITCSYSNAYPNHLLSSVSHSCGRAMNFGYESDLLAAVTVPSSGMSMAFLYNSDGELTNAVRTSSGGTQVKSYAYDSAAGYRNHSLIQRVNPAGHVFDWQYATNESGQTTSVGTDTIVDSQYMQTSLEYSTGGLHVTTATFERGSDSIGYQYHFDPVLKRIEHIIGPNPVSTNWEAVGQGHRYFYDGAADVTNEVVYDSTTGESLNWKREFDGQHNCTTESFGFSAEPSNVWTYTWNTNWNVLTGVTDPEGHKTEIEYSDALPASAKLYHTTEDYWETLMGYASNGLLSGVTNANGHWVNYNHDSYGNVTSTVPQVGPTVRATYTSLGHLQTIQMPPYAYFPDTSDPGSTNGIWMYRVTSNTVNELGWVSKTTYPHPDTGGTNGPSEFFYRDALGNVTNHVDIAGRSTEYTWLPTRKLSSVTQTLNGTNVTTSLTYDNQFNTLVIKDPLERTVESYVLDLQDRPVTVTNLEGQTMTVDYGVGNYVRSITRFDGTAVDNSYNSDGLLEFVDYPDATISMTCLKNGLLSTMENSLGTVSNSWTFANRLSAQTQVAPSGTVSYAQDPVGNVTGVTSVAGTQVNSFDEGERVSSIQSESFFQFAYNTNNGLLSSVVCTNSGIGVNYTMDAWDRVKSITWTNNSGETLRSFTYAYNGTGVISSVSHEDGSVVVCGYDGIDRLIGETQIDAQGNTNLDVSLIYDLAGNRTSKTRDGVEITYSLGDGNRLSGWSTVDTNFSVTLDVSGYADENIGTGERYGQLWVSNSLGTMTPYVNGEYFYAFGMLSALGTQEIVAAICDIAGNTTYATSSVCMSVVTNGSYQYNDAGCVTSMVYTGIAYSRNLGLSWNSQYQLTSASTNGTEVESYGYDALGRRVYIAQGGTTNWLVYDGAQVVAEVNGSGQLQKAYTWGTGIDNLLSMTVYSGGTGTTYYALTDHLGSIHAFADSTGSIVESYRWDAWGRVLGVCNSAGQPISASAIGNRYLWQGREYSWNTGLYHFRARWYDPVTGRWLSNDPIGISGGLNQYCFCANNPVMGRDPLGLDWLMYDGTTLIWYGGSVGDTSKKGQSFKATSGMPKQQTPSEHTNIGGPIPEGTYVAKIWLDIKKAEVDSDDNTLKPGWGIQDIPTFKDEKGQIQTISPDWGFHRVRIDAQKGTDTHKRGGFYIHDSHKGYSHGCIETEEAFFEKLISYKNAKNRSIDLVVKYTGETTYGGTKK